jgi:hypothetical protein
MTTLDTWARDWGVPAAALADLRHRIGLDAPPPQEQGARGLSEAAVQANVRLEASRKGLRVFRNNVGVLEDRRGVPVRYGLANDSKTVNTSLKSGDLIGLRPVVITPAHVGQTIGQFVSRECKRADWRHRPADEHEQAQLRWALLVLSLGGDAAFATGPGTL